MCSGALLRFVSTQGHFLQILPSDPKVMMSPQLLSCPSGLLLLRVAQSVAQDHPLFSAWKSFTCWSSFCQRHKSQAVSVVFFFCDADALVPMFDPTASIQCHILLAPHHQAGTWCRWRGNWRGHIWRTTWEMVTREVCMIERNPSGTASQRRLRSWKKELPLFPYASCQLCHVMLCHGEVW